MNQNCLYNWYINPGQVTNNCTDSKTAVENNGVLQKTLRYLNDIEEVSWVDIEDNDVYIGFSSYPKDIDLIIRTAALKGNKAINFGVHVWAVDANKYKKGWRAGNGAYYTEATARYGKIE